MMSEPLLLRSETSGVLEIVLNRPAKLNAINREMWEGIRDAVEHFRVQHDLRVMLFRANGRYFSAGNDLTDYDGDFDDSPMRARNWMRRDLAAGMHRMLVEME
jgi:enoyl-CoA hydratase/carnithine racemase